MAIRVLLIVFALLLFHVVWPLPWYALAVLGGVIGIIKGYTSGDGIANIFNIKRYLTHFTIDKHVRKPFSL